MALDDDFVNEGEDESHEVDVQIDTITGEIDSLAFGLYVKLNSF